MGKWRPPSKWDKRRAALIGLLGEPLRTHGPYVYWRNLHVCIEEDGTVSGFWATGPVARRLVELLAEDAAA